ncbi:large ribosomal subunit protein mL41B-like [Rhopilema esculentum]|uniref:large ribosomal subunit protein mL41B-like n=1 Tax=Rhopilema esculentum TaxID=499914 RepID=UPI0031E28E98
MQLTRILLGATRGVMTSKRGNKNFYKGRGVRNPGFITKKGKFVVVPKKVPEFVVPDLTGFQLKPYVAWKTPRAQTEPMTAEKLVRDIKMNINRIEHFEVP